MLCKPGATPWNLLGWCSWDLLIPQQWGENTGSWFHRSQVFTLWWTAWAILTYLRIYNPLHYNRMFCLGCTKKEGAIISHAIINVRDFRQYLHAAVDLPRLESSHNQQLQKEGWNSHVARLHWVWQWEEDISSWSHIMIIFYAGKWALTVTYFLL